MHSLGDDDHEGSRVDAQAANLLEAGRQHGLGVEHNDRVVFDRERHAGAGVEEPLTGVTGPGLLERPVSDGQDTTADAQRCAPARVETGPDLEIDLGIESRGSRR